MRFVRSVVALSLAACSAESSGLDPTVPFLDAASVDAGRRDAGSVYDTGTTPEASAVDASAVDASAVDASMPSDASTTEAAVDSGRPDAAPQPDAATDASSPLDAATATDAGASYAHTIAIDGVNDFAASEAFATTTSGFTLYAAWDATYFYLGASGSDVQTTSSSTKWWTVYLSNAAGTGSTTGVTYRTQTPALPFPAAWHLRWKTTNDYTNALTWSGTSWVDAALSFPGNVFRGAGNDFVELRLARATLGNPHAVKVVSAFINEANGGEATFAGAPSTAFQDGVNPSFAKAYAFNLTQSPASAVVVP